MHRLHRIRPDGFTLALLAVVVTASLLPVLGAVADGLKTVSAVAVALLFFLHGARLPRETVLAGLTHWRLQLAVLASTFVVFPLLGLALAAV